MRQFSVIISSIFILILFTLATAEADQRKHTYCLDHIDLHPGAEYQEGGSKYVKADHTKKQVKSSELDDGHKSHTDEDESIESAGLKEKEESHGMHKGQNGGLFFMAPNLIHHVELVFSEKCGFSVIIFNAFTKPIKVNEFQAFIKYIPEDEDQMEIVRFLSPSGDSSLLKATDFPEIDGPYEIVLYLKFPKSEEPALFNFPVTQGS